jgi:hypothetical protein
LNIICDRRELVLIEEILVQMHETMKEGAEGFKGEV